jgi:hypothetical protein
MSDFFGNLMSGISTIGGGLLGSIGLNQQDRISRQNLDFQKHAYYHGVEDRMNDLRNAGINPIMAAGGGGTPATAGGAPQQQDTSANKLAMAQMLNDIGKSAAETRLLWKQKDMLDEQIREQRANATVAEVAQRIAQGTEGEKIELTRQELKNAQIHWKEADWRNKLAEQGLTEQKWDFAKQKLLGMPKGVDPSSLEGWLYMMEDPNVPTAFKTAFGIKGTWSEIKDIWRTFIGAVEQPRGQYMRQSN